MDGLTHTCMCVHGTVQKKKKKKKKKNRTSRQTQAGIGHSAPAHRGGHVQNSRHRKQRRRRQRTRP